jgi:hypothetical protein
MARPGEPEVVKTTIVGGQPPREGRNIGDVPRGVEVLVKKAAVDPAFKKTLLEKRAGAADAIALTLSAAEEAMLEAVPEAQLRAIIGNTKVSPGLRPAFLCAAAGAMLAALGAATYAEDPDEWEMRTTGIDAEMPPKAETGDVPPNNIAKAEYATLSGSITDEKGQPIGGVLVVVKGTNRFSTTDGNGYYEITRIPEGSYEVRASRVKYDGQIVEAVKFINGYRTNLSFVLKSNPKSEGFTDEPVIKGIRPDQP